MPDFSLCFGRCGDDERTPLRVCSDCLRRTTPPGERQAYMDPPARRVAGKPVFVCAMRLAPAEQMSEVA